MTVRYPSNAEKLLQKASCVVAAADLGSARPNQLRSGATLGSRFNRCPGRGKEQKSHLGAGLHFRQRHLRAPGPRRNHAGGATRPGARFRGRGRAAARLADSPLWAPGRGPPQGGLAGSRLRAGVRGRARGGRPRRGQRRPAPRARRSWGRGRATPARRPGPGLTWAAAPAPREAGEDGRLRPEARPRSPVGLGRGLPLGVSQVAPGPFPPPSARASGCAAPSSPTSPSPAAAGPADSRR